MRRTDLRSARKLVRLNRGGLENFPIFFSMTDAPDFFQILSDSSDFFQTLTDFFFQIIIIPYCPLKGK